MCEIGVRTIVVFLEDAVVDEGLSQLFVAVRRCSSPEVLVSRSVSIRSGDAGISDAMLLLADRS